MNIVVFTACFIFLSMAAVAQESLTLAQCYQKALLQSETLKISQGDIEQQEARYKELLSSVLPKSGFAYTYFRQDRAAGDGGSFSDAERPEAKLYLTQPIFHGFREFTALKGAKAQRTANQKRYAYASKLVLKDVADAFFLVLQIENDIRDNQILIDLTQNRIKELQGRERLGKSRPSEILTAESQLASLLASTEKSKGDLLVARDLLSFLCGEEVRTAALTDTINPQAPPLTPSAIEKAQMRRSDVVYYASQLEVDRLLVEYARRDAYPAVDFRGNYYLKRTGFQKNIDWDFSIDVDAPFYRGGVVQAKVWQAKIALGQSEQRLAQAKRQAASDIHRADGLLRSANARATLLNEAYKKAEASYEMQLKEYRLGLVNNLEVLAAMNTMIENKVAFDRALIESKLRWVQLRLALEENL